MMLINTANKIYVDTSDETKRYVDSVTPFVHLQNEYTATNNINMTGFTLQNVRGPVNPKDAATKEYVDKDLAFEARNGGYNAKSSIYIGGNKFGGIREPKKNGEYVEKYVDDYVEKSKDEDDVFVSPSGVNMVGKKLSGLPLPSDLHEAASKEYADRVGVYARAHADRVGASAGEYVDRSTDLLERRFHDLPFAF